MSADLAIVRAQLTRDESDRPYAYDDATGKRVLRGDTLRGNLTVGIGYNLSAKPLSDQVRALLLQECIDEAIADLKQFGWFLLLDRPRMHAVINLRFNLGPGTFRTFVKFIDAMKRKDYVAAAHELRSANWYTQVGARGERIASAIETGIEAA